MQTPVHVPVTDAAPVELGTFESRLGAVALNNLGAGTIRLLGAETDDVGTQGWPLAPGEKESYVVDGKLWAQAETVGSNDIAIMYVDI